MRDDTKNGCITDQPRGRKFLSLKTNIQQANVTDFHICCQDEAEGHPNLLPGDWLKVEDRIPSTQRIFFCRLAFVATVAAVAVVDHTSDAHVDN